MEIIKHPRIIERLINPEDGPTPNGLVTHIWHKIHRNQENVNQTRLRYEPKGPEERVIATDAEASTLYALDIIQQPFPLGEKVISTHGASSFAYATRVLKQRFKPGEYAIILVGLGDEYEQKMRYLGVQLDQGYQRLNRARLKLDSTIDSINDPNSDVNNMELRYFLINTRYGL